MIAQYKNSDIKHNTNSENGEINKFKKAKQKEATDAFVQKTRITRYLDKARKVRTIEFRLYMTCDAISTCLAPLDTRRTS